MKYDAISEGKQASRSISERIGRELEAFVEPMVMELDQRIDKRLVRTSLVTLQVIVQLRNRSQGLQLSELGGYILSPA
jgi:hypothetical protein